MKAYNEMNTQTRSLKETRALAGRFIAELAKRGKQKNAFVVGLSGNLGSGKTAFTKELAAVLGIKDTVQSPTFILERIYKIPPKSVLAKHWKHLVHIDAYRLEGVKELAHLGWEEIARDPKNLIFIEWPERVADALPKDMMKIRFTFINERTREIAWR
ncbi:MAG: tRNA (adenosine(37)-N6)-threonylcarbamoyltransferase complex ATPase subunit type 1 TsaE [Patescibacteria group bacterium]|nr:tRNA (adenosine(37)-N6)-threonylcarbamoyltransferase complex ATPase subunit type 1 TsaE [Patescibacteria group bacterium]